MRNFSLLVILAVLCLGVGLVLSCGGDDDDDSSDDAPNDDDGADDDTGDDDLIDNGDGTATDPETGLMWEVTPLGGMLDRPRSLLYCDDLYLGGHNDWHLPTIWELRSLIRGCDATATGGACGVTDDCTSASGCWNDGCNGCEYLAGPASGGAYWPAEISGEIVSYWSSTQNAESVYWWGISFGSGRVDRYYLGKSDPDDYFATPDPSVISARCVRVAGADDDDDLPTWTDPSSGLTWQVDPAIDYTSLHDAITYCDGLTLDGGGWHVPTISELRTLIRGCDSTVTGGSCGVTDSCLGSSCEDVSCSSCIIGDGPNNGCYGPSEMPGECDKYWSSSEVADFVTSVWVVDFDSGNVHGYGTLPNTVYTVRCVR